MRYNPDIHKRQSIRLKGYDYSQCGAYYVTIVAKNRECLFGDIVNGGMLLNEYGVVVNKWWYALENKFGHIELDEYVIMPNHFHGIIKIPSNIGRGEVTSPSNIIHGINQGGDTPPLRKCTLGQMVAYFKYQSTKHINIIRNTPGVPVWQRNYYERVIRNELELTKMREYIKNNPLQWNLDVENPGLP